MDDVRENLGALLTEYFGIGDSYAYKLTRDKGAFSIGTMTLDDFEEFDADTVAEIVEYLIAGGVTVQRWIPVTEQLPEEREECDEGEKHMVSDIVQVSVQDSLGNRFVSDDMLFDGIWVNYPWGDFEITHWKPLPEPAKGIAMGEVKGHWVLSVVEDEELMTPMVTGVWCNQCWKPGEKDMTECPHCGAQMEQEVTNERMDGLG